MGFFRPLRYYVMQIDQNWPKLLSKMGISKSALRLKRNFTFLNLARAKSEALYSIYSFFKQNIKSCNAKRRRQRRRTVKNNNRSNSKKNNNNFSRAAHFFVHFFCRCFARLHRETSRNFLVTSFMGEISYTCCCSLFFTAAHFHLAFTAATKFWCCSSNKKMSPLFFISRSRSLSPFNFSLSFAGLPATFSFSLSFSGSTFQIWEHDN